jgi:hypothetical protein
VLVPSETRIFALAVCCAPGAYCIAILMFPYLIRFSWLQCALHFIRKTWELFCYSWSRSVLGLLPIEVCSTMKVQNSLLQIQQRWARTSMFARWCFSGLYLVLYLMSGVICMSGVMCVKT